MIRTYRPGEIPSDQPSVSATKVVNRYCPVFVGWLPFGEPSAVVMIAIFRCFGTSGMP
jgi:hypothetical protein